MSQRRRTKKSSQSSISGNSSTSQNYIENSLNTQISNDENLSNEEHAHHVNNVVKYILAADNSKIPIVRSTISKVVNCHGKKFRAVMNTVQEVMKDVFGYKLVDVENGKFILCNMLKNDLPHLRFDEDTQNYYVLLFLTLVHIYMSGEICTEASLIDFLTKLEIISEGNMKNNTFGNVLELITVNFVKEKYIIMEKTENIENCEVEFKWGVRANEELSIRSVMEFVSKVYGGRDIKTWPEQYKGMIEREGPIIEEQNITET